MSTDNESFVRVFDRAGADYQQAAGPFIDSVADLVAERAMAADPGSVIDLATGPGTVLAALERRGRTPELIGFDLAERQLQAGRKRLAAAKSRVRFAHMDVGSLQVKDRAADVVTCSLGLPYLDDPLRGVREAARVAKRGGLVLFTTFGRPIFGDAGQRLGWALDRLGVPNSPAPAAHSSEMLAQWAFRANLLDVVIEEHDIPVRYPDLATWWSVCDMLAFLVRLEGESPDKTSAAQDLLADDERVVGPGGEVAQLVRICLLQARAG